MCTAQNNNAWPVLFCGLSHCMGTCGPRFCRPFFIKSSFFQANTKLSHTEHFFCMVTLLASSAQQYSNDRNEKIRKKQTLWTQWWQDYLPSLHDKRKTWLKCQWWSSRIYIYFVGNTHTEALMSLLSKSLTQATPYLVAVHLYDRCPSSISTSEISHVTENGCWLWVKDNCNHPSFARRTRHFLVNYYSRLVSSVKSAGLLSGRTTLRVFKVTEKKLLWHLPNS